MKATVTAESLWAALAKRYAPPTWALLAQVGNGTGFTANRWADALAMGLWPSRGLHLHGFEIKVSRGDWLRELKRPEKAEEIAGFCDFWWIVTAPVIVLEGELPPAWGLLVLEGRRLVQAKAAIVNPNRVPLDVSMVAAILRRATERMVPRASIEGLIDAARAEGEKAGAERAARDDDAAAARRELADVRQSIREFEEAAGVEIGVKWGSGDVGRRFRIAAALDETRAGWTLRGVENHLVAALERVRDARKATSEPERTEP